MVEFILRDQSAQVLLRGYFGASAGNSVPGVFENNGDINNSEVNEAVDVAQGAANSEGNRCSSDFRWSWQNFGRDSFACVQPNRLAQPDGINEQYGIREVQHVQLELSEEGSRPVLGIFREHYIRTQTVPVTVRWDRDGRIRFYREDISVRPPAITPPPPPPPPQPDPIADTYDAAASGLRNFFSGAATRISQGADSAIQSLRTLLG